MDKQTTLPSKIFIGAHVKIFGRVQLGEGLCIDSNALLYGPAELGSNSYIGPNSIIGFPSQGELHTIMLRSNREPRLKEGGKTRVGNGVVLRSNCVIYSSAEIGDHVRFGHNALIRENVTIGDHSLVGTNSVIDGSCTIGRRVSIQTGVYISTYTTIEDCVFLGPQSVLINDRYAMQKEYNLKGPTIRRGVSVGANATIFPDITIGEGAVIGAGAVVVNDVPPRTIVVGVPAEKLRDVPHDWQIQLKPPYLHRDQTQY